MTTENIVPDAPGAAQPDRVWIDGIGYPRIRHADSRRLACNFCGVRQGRFHALHCDSEICPVCRRAGSNCPHTWEYQPPETAPAPDLDVARHALLAAIEDEIRTVVNSAASGHAKLLDAHARQLAADAHEDAFLQAGCPPTPPRIGAATLPLTLDGGPGQAAYTPVDQRRPCATCPGWALDGSDFCADCSAEGGL